MNYWLLTTEYPPFYGGGISTYCLFTAEMLCNQGHSVTVFVNDDSVVDCDIISNGNLRIIRFNAERTGAKSYLGYVTNLSYEFAHIVKQFIETEGKPDIIEAQEYLGIAYYLLQFRALQYDWCSQIPVLITMHSPAFLYLEYNQAPLFKYPNYWIGEMERFCLQAADALVSPSQYLVKEVKQRYDFNTSNLTVLANPYKASAALELEETLGEQTEIIFFGKLSPQKGTFALLQYMAEMWVTGFSEPLFLIGGQDIIYHPEGKTMGEVVRQRYQKQISNGLLRLEDSISPVVVAQRMARAKVVVVPSLVDNLPYVVMEMMSLGLVVLVSQQGGQAEIVCEGFNGFVFDHQVPGSFQTQLQKVVALSKEERRQIGARAQESVLKKYNFQKIYAAKLDILQRLQGKRKFPTRDMFPYIRAGRYLNRNTQEPEKWSGSLSVVIPYYNMGRFIDETISSVKASIGGHVKEILLVNDGSTEPESINILQQYRHDPLCKVIDSPNLGLAHARNLGAHNAGGDILAFLDADDLVAPSYYQKAIKVLQAYKDVHFVGAWTQYFENSEKVWPTFTPEPPLLLYHNLVNSSALVYKKNSYLAAGANDGHMPFQGLEDYDSVLSMVKQGYPGVVLPEALFLYRVRKDSMIRGVSLGKKNILQDFMIQKHDRFYAEHAGEVIRLYHANGQGTVLDNPTLDFAFMLKFPFNNFLAREVVSLLRKNKRLKKLALKARNIFSK